MKTGNKLQKYIYGFSFFFLALTGFGQMPIYYRYHLSDVPGLGWLADFYVTHAMHYIAAIVFTALVIYTVIVFIAGGRGKITTSGYLKIFTIAGLLATGFFMVVRNLRGVVFNHGLVITMDLVHIALSMVLMFVSLYTLLFKKNWTQIGGCSSRGESGHAFPPGK